MSCWSSVLVASTALSNSATLDSADVNHVKALIMSSWKLTMRSKASFRLFLRESDLRERHNDNSVRLAQRTSTVPHLFAEVREPAQ